MDAVNGIADGFAVALSLENLGYVFIGVVIGMLVGVLPGLGPGATIALLLPVTYVMQPDSAIIMLAGIYYGAYYGGTVTSVLINLPGEAASVVTTFDGYQMAKQGRAGAALGIAAIGSFVGGLFAVVGLMTVAPQVADIALGLGPPEYAALALAGLLLVTLVNPGSILKGIISACIGLLVAVVGIDMVSGSARMTFGNQDLLGGIDLIAVAMGLFGIGDILYDLETSGRMATITAKVQGVWPSREDRRRSRGAIARGSVIGFVLGLFPGGGGVISSMASYATEKKLSRTPERFGKGAIEGVAGPETANNAGSTAAFLPLLTLGIPSNLVLAMLYGALLIQGITPGPALVEEHPNVFWGVICSMVIGNVMLLALSMPFVRMFVKVAQVRLGILASVIIVVTMAGIYSVRNSVSDMVVMVIFGLLGYVMRKSGYSPGPLVLAMVLGPLLETSFRQSLLLSGGSLDIFVTRPVPLLVIGGLLLVLVLTVTKRIRGGAATKQGHTDEPVGDDLESDDLETGDHETGDHEPTEAVDHDHPSRNTPRVGG